MKHLEKKPTGRLLLYIFLLLLALGAMVGLSKFRTLNGNGAGASTPAEGDTLRVAMQYAPGSFYLNEKKELDGVDYNALRELGLPYKIYPVSNPSEGLKGLDEGRYDLLVADMPLTSEISEKYLATLPIYTDYQVLVQRIDSGSAPLTSQIDLAGRTVVVSKGSPMVARLHNLEREIGAGINLIEREATSERLLMELALGADSVPLVVVNSSVAAELAKAYPQLDFSLPVSLTQFQPWLLNKGNEALRDTINSRLTKFAPLSP